MAQWPEWEHGRKLIGTRLEMVLWHWDNISLAPKFGKIFLD